MNEDNKKFLNTEDFTERITNVMNCKGITVDSLCQKLVDEVGYSITKNNLNIYLQRVPSVYFLIALSKALGVSTDYLLGLEDVNLYSTGLDYCYDDKKYKKYDGDYYFYFYPTVSNSPQKINVAKLTINKFVSYKAKLVIETDEKDKKVYTGDFLLSDIYNVGYIILKGINLGEMVFLSFCDPVINGEVVKTQIVLGSMMSVSSGDFKRVPVTSRFLISRTEISKDAEEIIKSNLLLNTKYININLECISEALNAINFSESQIEKIIKRLTSAFSEKKYYKIEESYILNTLKNDMNFSITQTEKIISALRLHSLSNANNKINKALDSRIYNYLSNERKNVKN